MVRTREPLGLVLLRERFCLLSQISLVELTMIGLIGVVGFIATTGTVIPGFTNSVGLGRKIDQKELTMVGLIVGGHR